MRTSRHQEIPRPASQQILLLLKTFAGSRLWLAHLAPRLEPALRGMSATIVQLVPMRIRKDRFCKIGNIHWIHATNLIYSTYTTSTLCLINPTFTMNFCRFSADQRLTVSMTYSYQ